MFYLATSFTEWLNKGYPAQRHLNSSRPYQCSWRFWVKGKSKNEISCGLLKDSCDSIGRSYPLLIMGNGPLEGWEHHWALVPEVCEAAWIQMETLSTKTFMNLRGLEQELASLPAPLPYWSPSRTTVDDYLKENDFTSASDLELFCDQLRGLSVKSSGIIILDQFCSYDIISKTKFVGSVLGRHFDCAPRTVFIGGTNEMVCYAFFRRPLSSSDFSTLWTHLPQRLQAGKQ